MVPSNASSLGQPWARAREGHFLLRESLGEGHRMGRQLWRKLEAERGRAEEFTFPSEASGSWGSSGV